MHTLLRLYIILYIGSAVTNLTNIEIKIMTKTNAKKEMSEHAKAAKEVRAMLKANGLVAKVKASAASMTSSLSITLEDVTPWTYDAVEKAVSKYQYGSFNGMTDMYSNDNQDHTIPQVRFVSVNTTFNDDLKQQALDKICEVYEIPSYTLAEAPDMLPIDHFNYALNTQSMIRSVLNNTLPQYYREVQFWTKPVKRIMSVAA